MDLNQDGLSFSLEGHAELVECAARVAKYGAGSAPNPFPVSFGRTEQARLAPIPCRLWPVPSPQATQHEPPRERGWLRWQWSSEEARVWTHYAEARVWRRGDSFSAEAWLPVDDRAVQTLLAGLSSAILHAMGGLILHASSVQLDGGVIAFLGPSGAGKSTASRHVEGASLFSVDRLAIAPLPAAGGPELERELRKPSDWMAYPLLGGTLLDPETPRSLPAWSPLRALFRVRQAARGHRVEGCSRIGKLAILRESTFLGGHGASVELELLSRLARLGADLPVARLHFSLGTSLASLLRRSVCESFTGVGA